MEELFVEIQNAAKVIAAPNCTAWISTITSLSAVAVAIIVAVKQNKILKTQNLIAHMQMEISEQQNRIALFDKRYEVYRLVIKVLNRVCSATLKRKKHKQKGRICGRIGAREIVKTARKACTYGGGANV